MDASRFFPCLSFWSPLISLLSLLSLSGSLLLFPADEASLLNRKAEDVADDGNGNRLNRETVEKALALVMVIKEGQLRLTVRP